VNAWLLLVLMCVTVWRLTRLVTTDQFPLIMIPREAVILFLHPAYAEDTSRDKYVAKRGRQPVNHMGEFGRTIAYLIACDWCMSFWVSLIVTYSVWYNTPWFTHWMMAVLYGTTAAGFAGWFASKNQ
jgi:hypothetical protein